MDEELLYHITYINRLDSISESGLVPGAPKSIGSESYTAHRKGAVFLTEFSGIAYWYNLACEWAHSYSDSPLNDGFVPVVLRVDTEILCIEDEEAKRDGRFDAWKCSGKIPIDDLEIWNGSGWISLEDNFEINANLAMEDDSDYYFLSDWENSLVPKNPWT